ncbi:MAG: cytidine/deoxycytidylate deaminase family protein [Candidatus Thermoplasmatota archaeon]|nr:cytidine/deoxycytidylate deaminase family protein [Candidatus Thermoplasmatota archaeon]MCL5794384.1 cytidine/deoxycytidylate deaminase family protein [Candidatus Thermoplasmatota archaeon]
MKPTWDQYFMRMAFLAASRSNCIRRKVGAVIVKDRNVIATGYNGPPSGMANCDKVGCVRIDLNIPSGERHELCRGLHAEQNAIIQAAVHGSIIAGGVIYSTTYPCVVCSKMLINAQIKEIIYNDGYPDDLAELMLVESNMPVRQLALPVDDIKNILGEYAWAQIGED